MASTFHGAEQCRLILMCSIQELHQGLEVSAETISPGNSQANRDVEAAVKIDKRLMRKGKASEDPFIGLLYVRNTPTKGTDTYPAQRLIGRKTKTSPKHRVQTTTKPLIAREGCTAEGREEGETPEKLRKCPRPLSTRDTVRIQPIQSRLKEWQEAKMTKRPIAHQQVIKGQKARHSGAQWYTDMPASTIPGSTSYYQIYHSTLQHHRWGPHRKRLKAH